MLNFFESEQRARAWGERLKWVCFTTSLERVKSIRLKDSLLRAIMSICTYWGRPWGVGFSDSMKSFFFSAKPRVFGEKLVIVSENWCYEETENKYFDTIIECIRLWLNSFSESRTPQQNRQHREINMATFQISTPTNNDNVAEVIKTFSDVSIRPATPETAARCVTRLLAARLFLDVVVFWVN